MSSRYLEIYFFLGLLLLASLLGVFIALPYLSVIILAGTAAIIVRPVHKHVSRWFGGHKSLAAFTVLLLALIVLGVPLSLFSFQMLNEAKNLLVGAANPQDFLAHNEWLNHKIAYLSDLTGGALPSNWPADWRNVITSAAGWLSRNLGDLFSGISQFFVDLFLGLMAFYYFLKDGESLRESISEHVPLPRSYVEKIMNRLDLTIRSVVMGSVIMALLQGLSAGLGFAFFGLPSPALWALATMIASLIPTFGTAVTTIPATLYLYMTGNTLGALGVLAWGVLVVGLIDNFVRPKLIQRQVDIHPFLILLSVVGGLTLFGPIGFLAGPLVLSLLFALFDIYPELISKSRT